MAHKILDNIAPEYKEGKNINMEQNNITKPNMNLGKDKDFTEDMWREIAMSFLLSKQRLFVNKLNEWLTILLNIKLSKYHN